MQLPVDFPKLTFESLVVEATVDGNALTLAMDGQSMVVPLSPCAPFGPADVAAAFTAGTAYVQRGEGANYFVKRPPLPGEGTNDQALASFAIPIG